MSNDATMLSRRTLLKGLGAAGGLLSLANLSSLSYLASAADPIHVGVFAPLSGGYAHLGGINFYEGALLAARDAENAGGRPIKLSMQDTGSDASTAHRRARALIGQGRVHCFIAAASSAEALSLEGAFWGENASYLVMGSHAIDERLPEAQQHVFSSAFREPLFIGGFASLLAKSVGQSARSVIINHCCQRSTPASANKRRRAWAQRHGWSETSLPQSYLIKARHGDPDLFTLHCGRGDARALLPGLNALIDEEAKWRRLPVIRWWSPSHFAQRLERAFGRRPSWAAALGYVSLARVCQLMETLNVGRSEMAIHWREKPDRRTKGMTEVFAIPGDARRAPHRELQSTTFRSFVAFC